jgi:hypothetical protein
MTDAAVFDQLVRNGCLAADAVAIGFQGTGAQRTRAIVSRALGSLLENGLIEVKDPAEWPAWLSLDEPHPAEREPVEDRMRALAADMGDMPLTATILRQFADEVAQVRAAGDRAIQSIVSRLPEGNVSP